jgi:hypothetical protein
LDDDPLPAVARTNHKIAFGRSRKQKRLPVGHGHWKYAAGRHNEPHSVTDREPIFRINTDGPVGTRRTQREMDDE